MKIYQHIAKRQETRDIFNLLYILYIYCNFKYLCFIILLCRFLFVSLHQIVARSISKNTKVTSNKPKNSQKSSKILFKIQHKTSKMNQKPTFFHSKTPKMMFPFFELGESWRKTPPSVYQKHALTSQKWCKSVSKFTSLSRKSTQFSLRAFLTNMLSTVKF